MGLKFRATDDSAAYTNREVESVAFASGDAYCCCQARCRVGGMRLQVLTVWCLGSRPMGAGSLGQGSETAILFRRCSVRGRKAVKTCGKCPKVYGQVKG